MPIGRELGEGGQSFEFPLRLLACGLGQIGLVDSLAEFFRFTDARIRFAELFFEFSHAPP